MDDVGQTLLNWASAFGTLEMVGYLTYACNLPDASKQSTLTAVARSRFCR